MLLVDALEAMSLVQRVPSPTDRRAYGLALTDIGRQTLSEVTRTVCEHDARIAAGLTDQEQQMLRAMLEKLGR